MMTTWTGEKKRTRIWRTLLTSFCLLSAIPTLISVPMYGHHGTNASYDMDKSVTLTGTVTEFVWTNPHCQLYFDVTDANGGVVNWGGETNSPGVLKLAGWTKDIVKPGDKVTVVVHPSKAGTAYGVIQSLTLPDGKVLSRGAQAGQ